jgi:hypothetical protein
MLFMRILNTLEHRIVGMTEHVTADSIESLKATLLNLIAGQVIRLSARDFRMLSGDDITAFCSEGRLMMGNLAAAANCSVDTSTGVTVFTKNPARPIAGVQSSLAGGVPKELKRSA